MLVYWHIDKLAWGMRMSRFDQGLMSSCPLTRVICRGAACQIIFLLIPVLAKETWKLKIQISFKNPNPNCQLGRRDLITAGTNLNAFDRLNYCWLQPRSPFERPSFKTAFCTTFSSVSSKIFLFHGSIWSNIWLLQLTLRSSQVSGLHGSSLASLERFRSSNHLIFPP